MPLIMIVLIAISLSMDAFSLALAYGTLSFKEKDIKILSMIVGIYHFFMPLIGMAVGNIIIKILPIPKELIVLIVFSVIGIQMIISTKEGEIKVLSIFEMLSFALAVSIDSFSVGLGLKTIYKVPIVCSLIFMSVSFLFTFFGLKLGKKLNDKIGNSATKLGGLMLIILGIVYMFK